MEPSEQAPSTSPPKRRRRRWLIIAFVLGLVSLISWWYWPRGDARFVGKWVAYTMGDKDEPECYFTFQANGSVTWTNVDRPGWSHDTVWQVDRETLQFGVKTPAQITSAFLSAQEWLNATFSLRYRLNEGLWDVLSVSRDRIELVLSSTRYKTTEVTMSLRRIPE